jgi:hypothetical protein
VRRLLTLATIGFLAGCAAPNARSAPSATPTGVPQPSVIASPISSSSPATPAIAIDGLAKSTVDGLTVRATAGTAGTQLGTIDTGQLGFVVAGPVSADGYAWYQLSAVGLPDTSAAGCEPPVVTTPFKCPDWLGWVAAGQPGGQAWLESTTLSCPASPMDLEAITASVGTRTALGRLACYGSSSIRVRAWWPQIPSDAGLGGACPANPTIWWLQCGGLNYNRLAISESAGFGGPGLNVMINPASGVKMPPRGQWVEVVGHLDDAAARDCAPVAGGEEDPVMLVLTCRGQLVAESVSPVAGPY